MGFYLYKNGAAVPLGGGVNRKATDKEYGLVRLSPSGAATDSTGLAVPVTELNAALEGTIANKIEGIFSEISDRFSEIKSIPFQIPENGQITINEPYDRFAQIMFVQNNISSSSAAFFLMGYGPGVPRYQHVNIFSSDAFHEVTAEGQSYILKNNSGNEIGRAHV